MKREIILSSAFLLALAAQAQTKQQIKKDDQPVNLGAYYAQKYGTRIKAVESPMIPTAQPNNPAPDTPPVLEAARSKTITPPSQWKMFCASMNIYGVTESRSEPLQYHDELNAVSFIHRKSITYVTDIIYSTDPENSGSMVGEVSQDWGTYWDSTLIWRDNTNYGRYPQGGVWAKPKDSTLRGSQIIATGPTNHSTANWFGSFIASKELDSIGGSANNNSISPVGGATVFASNTAPYTAGRRIDFATYGFAATDDGRVRAMGLNIKQVNPSYSGPMGAAMAVGTFDTTNKIFNWQIDTLGPQVEQTSGGAPDMLNEPEMAWSEDGRVGFIWFIGVRKHRPGMGDTLANNGYQPIVYKTTDSGATWTELPRMNFNNNPVMDPVMNHIFGVRNDTTNTLAIPFFTPGEGYDGVVDRNGRLHIVSTVVGTFSSHPDSLGFVFSITLPSDGQAYSYGQRPGLRPYIYDFTETPTGWTCTVIDSMSTEGPASAAGTSPTTNGYNDNPWAPDPTDQSKIQVDGRIQASRSADGKYLVYTWAESDTANTTGGRKWNTIPNVKARMVTVGVETSTATPATMTVHPTEINVTSPFGTNPPYTSHAQVAAHATNHFISPKLAVISSSTSSGVALGLPITVSNSAPYRHWLPNRHWYFSANLNFDNVPLSQIKWPEPKRKSSVGISEYEYAVIPAVVYPNPANVNASVRYTLDYATRVEIVVSNVLGQTVGSYSREGGQGVNSFSLNTAQFENGLYTVTLKTGDAQSTLKVLVQH